MTPEQMDACMDAYRKCKEEGLPLHDFQAFSQGWANALAATDRQVDL